MGGGCQDLLNGQSQCTGPDAHNTFVRSDNVQVCKSNANHVIFYTVEKLSCG